MTTYQINDEVVKLGTDYTAGRTGTVVEIQSNEIFQQTRIRVFWTNHGMRTWIKPSGIRKA